MKPNLNSVEFERAVTVEEMRNSDAYTIANFVPGRELMYRAAMGVYNALEWTGKKIAIVSGSGNNGGDGYALASILADKGITAHVFRTSEKLSEDGGYYFAQCVSHGLPVQMLAENTDLSGYDIIADCVLGTGFKGTPKGMAATAIRKINEAEAYVISVDINSGMDGDTGEAELAVKSDKTVSVGFYKKGYFLGKASEYIGDLVNVDIGIVYHPRNV